MTTDIVALLIVALASVWAGHVIGKDSGRRDGLAEGERRAVEAARRRYGPLVATWLEEELAADDRPVLPN